jgi:CcmD family protein
MTAINALLDLFLQVGIADPNKFNHFMILGYFVMWLIVVFYVFMLANRQRNVREELKLLHQLLKEDEEADNK